MQRSDCLPRSGPQVILRKLRVDDLRAFQAYRHDPEVNRLQGWLPEPDQEALEFLSRMGEAIPFIPGEWFQIGIADKISDSLIGDLGVRVSEDEKTAEVGISLGTPAQGRGLATEALSLIINLLFERTPINAVGAITDQRNLPAIRLLERVGMVRGRSKKVEFRGYPCTEISFELSRPIDDGRS